MPSFDESWEQTYRAGKQLNRYPWTDVVTFVFRHKPARPASEISVLEVGCGGGANVAFFAAEGFRAFGLDASSSAIASAQQRLAAANLAADLQVGDFTCLPYAAESMDLVVDRAALSHADAASIAKAVVEIRRVLKPGGKFLFNPFGDSHGGFAPAALGSDGTSLGAGAGTLAGLQVTFFNPREIASLFAEGWRLIHCVRREELDMLDPANFFANYIVVAEKK
ncbi:MAG TPA: class I SAM-dependent methyltransferase [Magnetospirillaceae bacterium]|nr:class I SAM-dependent methyltransferase [Magnetospirillaceae bacterium]